MKINNLSGQAWKGSERERPGLRLRTVLATQARSNVSITFNFDAPVCPQWGHAVSRRWSS